MIIGEQHLQLAAPKTVHPLLHQYVPILEASARRAEVESSRKGNAFRLGVTSTRRHAGVSTLAANLALAAVKIVRRSTTLVEANTAHPSMRKYFAPHIPDRANGLTELLHKQCEVNDAVYPSQSAGLSLVPAGNLAAPPRLPQSPDVHLDAVLTKIQNEFDWLIVDLPPISDPATRAAAACLDGTILLVYGNRTTSTQLNEAVSRYAKLGIPVLGTVYRHSSP